MASTFQQPLMEVRPEEVVQLHRPEDRINSHGRQDVIIKDGISVFAMSALTGLGKTTLVKQYLQDHPALSVLSLTYRKCMAASAAEVLQLEYYENERARTAERISTTIHSLPKLRRLQYDVVIADEADSLRNVGAESTMDDRYEACMAALAKYLETAKLVILLQADLTETVISWICGFMKVDSMDRRFVQRVRIESLRGLWPVGLAEDLAHTLGEAKRMYKEQQELPVGARKPMMMFFTHVSKATRTGFIKLTSRFAIGLFRIYCWCFRSTHQLSPGSHAACLACQCLAILVSGHGSTKADQGRFGCRLRRSRW